MLWSDPENEPPKELRDMQETLRRLGLFLALDRKSTRLNSSHPSITLFPYTTLFRSVLDPHLLAELRAATRERTPGADFEYPYSGARTRPSPTLGACCGPTPRTSLPRNSATCRRPCADSASSSP